MRVTSSVVCAVSFGMLCITGRGGMVSLPNVLGEPVEISIGSIQGSNTGGHSRLEGAYIYLLEAGQNGYGSVAKSLMG